MSSGIYRADRFLAEAAPGLSRCSSSAAQCTPHADDLKSLQIAKKRKFALLRRLADFGVRETQRLLGLKSPGAVLAWEDERDMKRHPPAWAIEKLEAECEKRRSGLCA